ncbi:MAG TPA: hypothetical protein VD710_09335 [Nitrososphaeraceae archaeon]|nr:hypothetical protein [Nitrososphaeraceae archaeon]
MTRVARFADMRGIVYQASSCFFVSETRYKISNVARFQSEKWQV